MPTELLEYGLGGIFIQRHLRKGRTIKPALNKDGYACVSLTKDNQAKSFRVHRLVAKEFIPNPDNKPEVNHLNGKKSDNWLTNLEWCTCKENREHALKLGLHATGERVKSSKLTEEQVKEIKDICIPGDCEFGVTALARKYKVNRSTISNIIHGRQWKGVG